MPAFAQTAYGKDQVLRLPHKALLFLTHVIENQQRQPALARVRTFPLRQVIREFRIGCGQRADLLRMFLHVQVQAAFADSQLHESEKEVLYVVAEELGLSRMQFEQMLAMEIAARQFTQGGFYRQIPTRQLSTARWLPIPTTRRIPTIFRPNTKRCYKVLGVSESDDRNAVKRAYRRLMNEHQSG